MSALLGTSLAVFIGISVVLAGGAAWLMGQAIASTWRPAWHIVPYGLLLAAVARFLIYGLFDGELLSLSGYIADAVVIIALAALAFRTTRVRRMVRQYPWLYEPAGPFSWRRRQDGAAPEA